MLQCVPICHIKQCIYNKILNVAKQSGITFEFTLVHKQNCNICVNMC